MVVYYNEYTRHGKLIQNTKIQYLAFYNLGTKQLQFNGGI